METLRSNPSRKCQNHPKDGSSILLHNHNDTLPSPTPNLLNPTRLHHGHKLHQALQHPTSFLLIIIVPIYDRIFVPVARKITGIPTGITHLQRIGVGLILSCISMAVAAIVEVKRKNVAREKNMLDAFPFRQLPISTFWLSFQYFIFGIADMFTYVALLEFFYSEAPKGLKSTSACFLWCSMALGYFMSTIVVKSVNGATKDTTASGGWLAGNNINRNHLNLFYLFLSIVSLINFIIYLFVSRR